MRNIRGRYGRGAHPYPVRGTVIATIAGAAALGIAACGAATTPRANARRTSALTATAASLHAHGKTPKQIALADLAAVAKKPKFKVNPPVNMRKLKKENVTVVLSTAAVPFVAAIGAGAQQAGTALGWHVSVVDGKGDVTQWSQLVEQAVSQKVNGIIMVGASPQEVRPAMAKAKAAHIPIVDAVSVDQTRDSLIPGTFAHASISFYHSGQLQADYVIAHGTPHAQVLIFGDNEFPGEVARVQGMKAEFHKLCRGCKVTVQDTQVASLATNMASTTQTLLRRDPKVTWVLPTYDAQATYIVPAIKAAGLAGKVKVVSSDAVPANLAFVAKNNVEVADVGEPAGWAGWAAVDEIGRALAHQRPVPPNIPLRMFTAANLRHVNVNSSNQLFGTSYIAGYKKEWGLK